MTTKVDTKEVSVNGSTPSDTSTWTETDDEMQMRQLIFQKKDRPEELVPVPEWGMKVLVRAMNGTQRAIYEGLPQDPGMNRLNIRRAYAEAVMMCCVHPKTRKPVFKATDSDELMDEHNGAIINLLATKALELSGMLARQQETVAKNSGATSITTTDSPSASATTA